MSQGQVEEAVSNYTEAVRLTKNVFPVWEQLLYGLEELGEYEEMGRVADEALNYYPNQPICYYYLGKSFGDRIEEELPKEELFLRGITTADYRKERSSFVIKLDTDCKKSTSGLLLLEVVNAILAVGSFGSTNKTRS